MVDILSIFSSVFGTPDLPYSVGRTSVDPSDYRYPIDQNYPAYIQYRAKKVLTPALRGANALINEYKATVPEALSTADGVNATGAGPTGPRQFGPKTEYESQLSDASEMQGYNANKAIEDAKNSGNYNQGLLGFATTYRPGKPIRLYFPQSVQIHDNIQYDQVGLGLAGAAGLMAMNRGQDIVEAVKAGATETGKSLYSLFGLGNVDDEAARIAAARASSMVSALTPAGAQGALALGLQVKVNPNTRSIFTGVTVRNFQFTYDFHANSKEEARMVQRIVKKFRTTMYPKAIPDGALDAGLPLGYEFPDLFEIRFKFGNGGDIDMPQPLLCYLRDVNTTYNPGSMSFHADGKPTHVQLSLTFQEFRALNKQDIEKEGGH